MFTLNLIEAIRSVSSQIIPDMLDEDACDPAIVAEMTLDADRLNLHGYPEANSEVKTLCDEHGWNAVRKHAEKYVCTEGR